MCHGGRHRYETWDTYEAQQPPERGDLRVSDADRDAAVEALRGHAQAGRLTSDELEERVELALAAKTRDDLANLQRDLPGTARRVVARPRAQPHGLPPFVPIALMLIVIWAISGAGYFWPVWPLLWFAFFGLMRGGRGHMHVTGNTRRTW